MVATRSQGYAPVKEAPTAAEAETPLSPRGGLSLHQQKKFFQELENTGGLWASVKKVCDRNTDDFGKRGSELRRQYQNRVNHFRGRKTIFEYYSFLESLGITPNQQPNRGVRRAELSDEEESYSSAVSTPSHRPPRTPSRSTPFVVPSTPVYPD
jgi:hypothetical protein